MNDMLLGILIAAVVLLVKSVPMLIARIGFAYITSFWMQRRGDETSNCCRPDDPDGRLTTYKGALDGLKKNIGLYDEALAAATILAIFLLGGYFEADVEPFITFLVIFTVSASLLLYWMQRRLVESLNWELLRCMRGNP